MIERIAKIMRRTELHSGGCIATSAGEADSGNFAVLVAAMAGGAPIDRQAARGDKQNNIIFSHNL